MPPAAARSRWSAGLGPPAITDSEGDAIYAALQRREGESVMLTIALIVAAMIAVAGLELWLFWRVGERDQRRRVRTREDVDAADAEPRPAGVQPTESRPWRYPSSARRRPRHLHVRSVVVLVVLAALLAPQAAVLIDAVI